MEYGIFCFFYIDFFSLSVLCIKNILAIYLQELADVESNGF